MRTTAALEKIGQLLEGRHENPFELLGPHEVDHSGHRVLAVRAFLPHSRQAWVVDPAHGETPRPMRRIHPAGLFEAICPVPEDGGSPRYMIQVAEESGEKTTMHDPYAFPHFLTDDPVCLPDAFLIQSGEFPVEYYPRNPERVCFLS